MSGFFALLDDIASLMDDVSIMAKVAGKKTAGILGDDLAVGADQASRFRASRELPVLWKITKGSFINKLIILPFAFLLSAFLPQVIVPVLLIGGVYLSYEGVEKIVHTFFHKKQHDISEIIETETDEELLLAEKSKIKSTILTDFILSIEIIMIALGTVTEETLGMQIIVVSIIAIVATIGVYGIVALMVRMDDVGFKLIRIAKNKNKIINNVYASIGKALIWTLPKLIQLLAVVGTLAMLLVGGGMYVHNIPEVHDFFHTLPSILSELLVGLIVGFIAYLIIEVFQIIKKHFFK
jgi:predicted DNA repair protein MutK